MIILFLCTAHNSLSQRLYVTLSLEHHVTIEYALSDNLMISAAELANPDLIICPFLIAKVPKEVYQRYLTLIVHPGPPGDAGPSSLDWLMMGDDGTIEDASALLAMLHDSSTSLIGRKFWGVTVLQAIERFDAGPVWAFEQFPVDIDQPIRTKSSLYRGPVTEAALLAVVEGIARIRQAAEQRTDEDGPETFVSGSLPSTKIPPDLKPDPSFAQFSIGAHKAFLGGPTRHRPILRPSQRDFDVLHCPARHISRFIRSADSQPGVLSTVFGPRLYIYGGFVEESSRRSQYICRPGTIVATRYGAIGLLTQDLYVLWISHIRRPKTKKDKALFPKVPAVDGLVELGILNLEKVAELHWPPNRPDQHSWTFVPHSMQDLWLDFNSPLPDRAMSQAETESSTAYVYFDFYNGAMSTIQCRRLASVLRDLLALSVKAVVLMGGAYFSNGIALNVIEASAKPADEAWANINALDDVIRLILFDFTKHKVKTVAALRGNAAAGGVALAAACDHVIAGDAVVVNPAYRALGLNGSEYHTLTYPGRCGVEGARRLLNEMLPLSAEQALDTGLVDFVVNGLETELDARIQLQVENLLLDTTSSTRTTCWKKTAFTEQQLADARAYELGEMAKDFWSPRSARFFSCCHDFVRKVSPKATPIRFAKHRRVEGISQVEDQAELDTFEDMALWRVRQDEQLLLDKGLENEIDVPGALQATSSEPIFACYYGDAGGNAD